MVINNTGNIVILVVRIVVLAIVPRVINIIMCGFRMRVGPSFRTACS